MYIVVNIGFVSLALKYGQKPMDVVEAMEFLSLKVGLVIVVLGIMHFFNMFILIRFRSSRLFNAFKPKDAEFSAETVQAEQPAT